MNLFTKHTDATAPQGAAEVLAMAKERYGFIPNLAAYVAESPLVLGAVLKLSESFDQATLTVQEQQLVLLTVSALNDCSYCRTAHLALGRKAGLDGETLAAAVAYRPLGDRRLDALCVFTRKLVEAGGRVGEESVRAFLAAGYTRAQVFEVVLGIGLKTITNFCNHLADAVPNPEFVAMAEGKQAA